MKTQEQLIAAWQRYYESLQPQIASQRAGQEIRFTLNTKTITLKQNLPSPGRGTSRLR